MRLREYLLIVELGGNDEQAGKVMILGLGLFRTLPGVGLYFNLIYRREGKARKKRRSLAGDAEVEDASSSESDESEADTGPKCSTFLTWSDNRRRTKKRLSGKSDDFRTGIP